MARFCTLSSSSKGNVTYLAGGDTSLLVDVGISLKQLKSQMSCRNLELDALSGILITHEHSDHIRGLGALLSLAKIPVYASRETLEQLVLSGVVPAGSELVAVTEEPFAIGDIKIKAFETPHDAAKSYGFRILMPDGNKVGIATDLGCVTAKVRRHLEGCDLVLLESNFDSGMLSCSRYPYLLKRRIRGDFGHLENQDCAREVTHLIKSGVTRFVLGHLSQQNNLPQLAYQTTYAALQLEQMQEGTDYLLSVAPAESAGEVVAF